MGAIMEMAKKTVWNQFMYSSKYFSMAWQNTTICIKGNLEKTIKDYLASLQQADLSHYIGVSGMH